MYFYIAVSLFQQAAKYIESGVFMTLGEKILQCEENMDFWYKY